MVNRNRVTKNIKIPQIVEDNEKIVLDNEEIKMVIR